MGGYQAGIAKFEGSDTQVFGISTDNTPSLGVFAKQLNLSFPLLSDFMRMTAASYGVLMADRGIANRATFIVDMDGKITYIEEGSSAVNISGAETACSRLGHKK
jgi:peroxiredoxin